MLPLIRDSALWTMGTDSADIDWEAAWKRRINQLPGSHKGSGTSAPSLVQTLLAQWRLHEPHSQLPGSYHNLACCLMPAEGGSQL